MTCIVAIAENGVVYMGADSLGSNLQTAAASVRKDPKIFRVDDFLFGFCGSYRIGQLLGYSYQPPDIEDMGVDRYMHTLFVDGVRTVLSDGGALVIENGEEVGGDFLVGYRGRLFHIQSDFQVAELEFNFNAIGCGAEVALGSLYATQDHDGGPDYRLAEALKASATFNCGVRGPFLFMENKSDK